jgi:apolipoprotein D and lipocalin family protein
MNNKMSLFILSLAFCFTSCKGNEKPTPVVQNFELDKYLGTWYEIARFDHVFERGLDFVSATYSILPNGKVQVLNKGVKKGKTKIAKGVAYLPDPNKKEGLLKVSFFRPFYADYRIIYLDTSYQHVIITGNTDKYLWILSRNATPSAEEKAELLSKCQAFGFDTQKLIFPQQTTTN